MHALIPVRAYLPFFHSAPIEHDEQLRQDSLNNREKFLRSLGSFLEAKNPSLTNISIKHAALPDQVIDWLEKNSWLSTTVFSQVVVLSSDVLVDVGQLKAINNDKELDNTFISHCGINELTDALEEAFFLSELSQPGCITVLKGVALSDNGTWNPISEKYAFSSLHFEDEDDPKWPSFYSLNLLETYRWAARVGFGQKSFATCRVGRALASLSHVVGLSHHREGEVLFRAMQGLEAFYCDGTGDLRRQLSEKIKIWIGQWSDKKNVIGNLYDVRSAFIHGSSSIEYLGHHRDPWVENEKAKNENNYATTFAVRLLVRTLQQCVETNTADIKWTFSAELYK